jgi:protein-tyrosine-phosphatase
MPGRLRSSPRAAGKRQARIEEGSVMLEGLAVGVIAAVLFGQGTTAAEKKQGETLVFVCEHGSVKSLIASQWFNKLAAERGLAFRAVSRGLTPDAAVPPAIVSHLAEDGLRPDGFVPKALSKADVAGVARIITIGVDATSVTEGVSAPVESWNDIPAASLDYAASRDAMRARIEELLTKMSPPKRPTPKTRK